MARCRPITVLLSLAALLIFLSHHFFAPSLTQRRIRKYSQSETRERLSEVFHKAEQRAADWLPTRARDESHALADSVRSHQFETARGTGAEEGEEEDEDAGEDAGEDEDEAEDEDEEDEEDEDEEDADDGDDGDDAGAEEVFGHKSLRDSAAAMEASAGDFGEVEGELEGDGRPASLGARVQLAGDALTAYPTAQSEFTCAPTVRQRPTRPLDYIVPLDAPTWPTNCEGREELCDAVRKTAIGREVLVAVCNSQVQGQLQKWVESNRRAKIENMMIIAIDSKLPAWLDENKVAYWRRTTKAAGSHKISAQKFMCVRGPHAAPLLGPALASAPSRPAQVRQGDPDHRLLGADVGHRRGLPSEPLPLPAPRRGHRGHHRRVGRRLRLRLARDARRPFPRPGRPVPARDAHHRVELGAVVRARDGRLATAHVHPVAPHGDRGQDVGPGGVRRGGGSPRA